MAHNHQYSAGYAHGHGQHTLPAGLDPRYTSTVPSPMSSHSGLPSPYTGSSTLPHPQTQHHGINYSPSSDPFSRPMTLPPWPLQQPAMTPASASYHPPPARNSYPSASMSTPQHHPAPRPASTGSHFGVFDAAGTMHTSSDDPAAAERQARELQRQNMKDRTCEECGRTFDKPSTCKTHMNSHTGETPFKCPVCGRGFTVLSNMHRHHRVCQQQYAAYAQANPGSLMLNPAPSSRP